MRYSTEEQADVQTVSLRQMPGQRDGPEVGSLQRRKENPIQTFLQEEG